MATMLISGANRGLGRATAEALARLHQAPTWPDRRDRAPDGQDGRLTAHAVRHTVLLGCRDPSMMHDEVARWRHEGLDVHAISLQVDNDASVVQAAAEVQARWGGIDVLINNAAVLHCGRDARLLTLSTACFQETWNVNALGPIRMARAFVPQMQARGGGRIVNVSSELASLGRASDRSDPTFDVGSGAYRMAKAALNMATIQLAKELSDAHILVNACCPGWTATDMGGPMAPRCLTDGIDVILWLATLPDEGPTGGFFQDRRPLPW